MDPNIRGTRTSAARGHGRRTLRPSLPTRIGRSGYGRRVLFEYARTSTELSEKVTRMEEWTLTFVMGARPEVLETDSVYPVSVLGEVESGALLPFGSLGIDIAIEDGQGIVCGVGERIADDDLDAVGIDGADACKGDGRGIIEERGEGKICGCEKQESVDSDVCIVEESRGRRDREDEDTQWTGTTFLLRER